MNRPIIITITLILIALLCGFFYSAFEYYEEEIDKGWSVNALQNPFLALELLSAKRGIQVVSSEAFQDFGDLDDYQVLYISDSALILSNQRLDALLKWVAQGGHLIVSPSNMKDSADDRLLSYFDITQEASFYSADDSEDADEDEDDTKSLNDQLRELNETLQTQANPVDTDKNNAPSLEDKERDSIQSREATYDQDELTELSFTGVEGSLFARLNQSTSLKHPAFYNNNWSSDVYEVNYWSSSKLGVRFAQISYARGLVTVMSGNDIWKNDAIALFDHAYLWLVLNNSNRAAILYGSTMPSLFSILNKYLPEVIYSAFALFIAWLWWRIKRFGPTRDVEIQSRRSYSEHIIASAGFFWRRQWQDKLLNPLRENVISLAETRMAGFALVEEDEKILMLAKQSGLSTTQVSQAFENEARLNQDLFIKTVQDLQRIRESL